MIPQKLLNSLFYSGFCCICGIIIISYINDLLLLVAVCFIMCQAHYIGVSARTLLNLTSQ
jgi:hypothetical protein